VALVVLALALVLTGCPNLTDSGGDDITYTAVQEGGSSSTVTSTSIKLSFSAALSDLTVGEINVNRDGGEVTKGNLTGDGSIWYLALDSVITQGNVAVSISKSGIENAVKPVAVYKNLADTGDSSTLVSISVSSSKTVYKIGEDLDKTTVTVTANYSDNTTKTVPDTDWNTDFDSSTEEEKTVAVTYQSKDATFAVRIVPQNTKDEDITAADKLIENEAAQAGLATADALAKEGAVAALTSVEDAQAKAAEIKTALDAYNTLSPEAKALLPAETKAKFDALAAILDKVNAQITKLAEENASPADQQAAADFRTTHETVLGLTADGITAANLTTNKLLVEVALSAYDALSAGAKALLTGEKTLLDSLLGKIGQLEAADKTALTMAITAANTAKSGVSVDTSAGNVPTGTKWVIQAVMTALTDAITAAEGVNTKSSATQTEVDNAVTALNSAVTTRLARRRR
jgi:hypothetical protein